MPKRTRCCGTSTGIIINHPTRSAVAFIGREWHPIGQAPPAGHVADEWASPEAAARGEAHEETGLTVGPLTLRWEGHRPNLCASPPAPEPGHYWHVFETTALTTDIRTADGETTNGRWLRIPEIQRLALATVEFAVTGADPRTQPRASLEAVWVDHLIATGHLAPLPRAEMLAVRQLYATPPASYWVDGREIPAIDYQL